MFAQRTALERLPRTRLLAGVTPLVPIKPGWWVKEEGQAAAGYGGHHVRGLEWILGEALESGGDVLVRGSVGSSFLVAAAVHGQRVGVRVHAVATPEHLGKNTLDHVRILHTHAEKIWPVPPPSRLPLVWAQAWASIRVIGNFRPIWTEAGLPVGWQGWVGGGYELARQLAALGGAFRVIVPTVSGGTAAALSVGLAGTPSTVVALTAKGSHRRLSALVRLIQWRMREAGVKVESPARIEVIQAQDPWEYAQQCPGLRVLLQTENLHPTEPLLKAALPTVPASLRGLLL